MTRSQHLPWLALIVLAVTAFYFQPLFGKASITWDAVSYFFPHQKHFADSLAAGQLPHWTSSVFSGFPFLSDMQVGAWYPLNWPFFFLGIEPRSIFFELWLHALLAAAGAYLLAARLFDNRPAGVIAGLIYAFSGFFAAHAEHVTLFQTAAWFPLLLWLFIVAVESGSRRRAVLCTLAGGCVALAGHFQTALYLFTAVAVFAGFHYARNPSRLKSAALLLLAVTAGAALLAAVQILPSAELTSQSIRQQVSAVKSPLGIAGPRSFATLVWPNALGVFSQTPYSGPPDITQHYFYAGLFAFLLAAAGLLVSPLRLTLSALILLPILYAAGSAGVLFTFVSKLPGFASVRGPSHAMFICSLGIALTAAAGWTWIGRLAPSAARRYLLPGLAVLCFADLHYWNMFANPLVYARGEYHQVVGDGLRQLQDWLAQIDRQNLERFAPTPEWAARFPVSAPFAYPLENASGLNPLQLSRYDAYLGASRRNPALLKGLGVKYVVQPDNRTLARLEGALPRFNFPPRILQTRDARALLDRLDPSTHGIVESDSANGEQVNAMAVAALKSHSETEYLLDVLSQGDCVMRIAIPWYPSWRAEIDGRGAELFPMDHALMGVRIPAGAHRVRLFYVPAAFWTGAALSLLTLLGCVSAAWRSP